LSLPLLAQEDGQSGSDIQELNSHPELNLNEDKTLILDDAKPSKGPQTNRDAQANTKKQEAQPKTSNPSNDKAEEDLSLLTSFTLSSKNLRYPISWMIEIFKSQLFLYQKLFKVFKI